MKEDYDVIIGLEIHVQTKTNSKMFCTCSAQYFEKEPNSQVCPVCMGLPGALPLPNKGAIEKCILLGLATNCKISKNIRFDRKHYFYPDLPKGYQISQYDNPICSNGYVSIGKDKKVDIERIHQEEDVAKSLHVKKGASSYTLIDYNKSGVPLIEIVTKPVIKSASDAKEYATKIRQIVRYLDISDADMEKGQMRCEPNISVQKKGTWKYEDGKILPAGDAKLNPKVEVKNIGSISAVEKSIEYEIDRLIKGIEEGEKIIQQTRGWNAQKGITEFQRSKESAEDYRYCPEPDIPIITIDEKTIERIKSGVVELADEKINRYMEKYGLSEYDANVLTS
jgi:aspartyl-tRNA(Asn)/glutamyl-tRNA(Gln) amidotransferase subunit B